MNEQTDQAHVGVPGDVAHSDAALVVSQMDGVLVNVSDGYCALVGKTREELIGRRADEAGVSTSERMQWILDRAPEIGRAHAFERNFDSPDGPQAVRTVIHRLTDDLLAVTLDPIEGTDAAGAESGSVLGSILDAVPVGVVFYDRDLRIVRVNRTVEETGRVRSEHLGLPITEAFPDADVSIIRSIRSVFATGQVIANHPVTHDDRALLLNFFPVRDSAGRVDQVGCLFSDVTDITTATAVIAAQQETILELSTPILELSDDILVAPLVGAIDSTRTRTLTSHLLGAISRLRSKVIIVDVTGVPVVDSTVADNLAQTLEAARLMGAAGILSGLSTPNACALATIGADLSNITTAGTLADALAVATRIVDTYAVAS